MPPFSNTLPSCPLESKESIQPVFTYLSTSILCVGSAVVVLAHLNSLSVFNRAIQHCSVRNWPYSLVLFSVGVAFALDGLRSLKTSGYNDSVSLLFAAVSLRALGVAVLAVALKFHRAKQGVLSKGEFVLPVTVPPSPGRTHTRASSVSRNNTNSEASIDAHVNEYDDSTPVSLDRWGFDLFAEDDSDPRAFVWEKTPTILALLVTEIIWLAIVFFITHNPETHEILLTLFRIIRLIPISTLTASLLYPALFLPTPPPSNSLREESASLLPPSNSPIPPPIHTPSQEPYIRRRSDSPTRSLADSLRSPTRSIESVDLFYDAIETHSHEPSMFTAAETMSVDSERRRRKWSVQKELKGLEVGVGMICMVTMEPAVLVYAVEFFFGSHDSCVFPPWMHKEKRWVSIEDLLVWLFVVGGVWGIMDAIWKEFKVVKREWVRVSVARVRDTFFGGRGLGTRVAGSG